jgi:hypothetical protein
MTLRTWIAALAAALAPLFQDAPAPGAPAQVPAGFPGLALEAAPRVEIPWNRFYDADEIYAHMDRLAVAWPSLVSYEVIGHSVEGREMRVYKIFDATTGDELDKPAMWVDANVHGNEVQGSEAGGRTPSEPPASGHRRRAAPPAPRSWSRPSGC